MGKTYRGRRGVRGLARVAVAAVLLLGSWAISGLAATATADSAQAPASEPGIYRIINVASGTSLRAYIPGRPIFVASTREYPGPFELWKITRSGGGVTIKNVGLSDVGRFGAYAVARRPEEGEPVITGHRPTIWSLESAGDDTYVIKAPYEDLLWNAEPPVIPRGEVRLRGADGSETQRWRIEPADD
ncbi:hypothetical protein AB0395_40340 [Streptosporangium sp. NPDC051023]|uniref:RICIN domain-containing protein n=1 Tax=Streptosporangium sp. NPDC051023 TaxID=3155410 RepID=UPI00344B7D32